MNYERIELLKENEKSTVELVRSKDSSRLFIRKKLRENETVYRELQKLSHPGLPKVYEVTASGDTVTVVEEYVDGNVLGNAPLSEKQMVTALRELCSVLGYLHAHGIIHRDIKPSNVIFAGDGHIRLIDFDAARLKKKEAEQDTVLLGTRGYAPPEQYGFAQTDERTDIYALGITMEQLLGDKSEKAVYRRVIERCTNFDPDKRYQRASQVKKDLSGGGSRRILGVCAVLLAAAVCLGAAWLLTKDASGKQETGTAGTVMLDAPEKPHWDSDSGIAIWGNVPESGTDGEVSYLYRIYHKDTEEVPDPEKDEWVLEDNMRGNGAINEEDNTYSVNLANDLKENGFYYFEVCAAGDGVSYENSPYVMSDAFEYTGEEAPMLPKPEGLAWKLVEGERQRSYYATWSNLDDYEDGDSFNVTVYDKNGNYVTNNIWTKEYVVERGQGGIIIVGEHLSDLDGAYRFTVQALTSRPNEYRSSPMPDPIPEEYYSPWFYRYN